ncbi:histamine H1 receptor-like isoform X2 [Artemia franciscana]|uniref:histamine H1 receptor-like isoform X2 n=1 Tax=Artemia franciscana TaxID=6661 RepID=UPI0032DA5BE3
MNLREKQSAYYKHSWPLGNAVCDFWLSVDYTASTASIFNLFVLSLDRYWSITSPLRYLKRRTKKRALILIGLAWTLSSIWLIPVTSWHLILQNGVRTKNPKTCDTEFSDHVSFKVSAAVINFYVPSVLMIYLYGRIFYEIRKRSRSELGQVRVSSYPNRVTKAEDKTCTSRFAKKTIRISDKTPSEDDLSDSVGREPSYTLNHQHSLLEGSCSSSSNGTRASSVSQYRSLTLFTVPFSFCQKEGYCTIDDCQFFGKVDVHIEYTRDSDSNNLLQEKHTKHKQCYASHVRGNKQVEWKPTELCENNGNTLKHESNKVLNSICDLNRRIPKVPQGYFQKEKKAAKQLGVIMGAFLLCWLPYFISFMVIAGCSECISHKFYLTTVWLGYMNSALNPILYPLCNVHFRRAFARMLRFKKSNGGVLPTINSSQLAKIKSYSNR